MRSAASMVAVLEQLVYPIHRGVDLLAELATLGSSGSMWPNPGDEKSLAVDDMVRPLWSRVEGVNGGASSRAAAL